MNTRRLVLVLGGLVVVVLLGLWLGSATRDLYLAGWIRCAFDSSQCPSVETTSALALGNYLVREIEEPTRFWIFHVQGGSIVEEVEYRPGTPLRVLPTGEDDAVLVFSNYPFSQVAFDWEGWDELPEGALDVHRWQNGQWRHVKTAQMGRVPAGPPDAAGYKLGWDCQWFVSDAVQVPLYERPGYGVQLTSSVQLPDLTRIRVEFLPCVPTWDPDNPQWQVIRIERLGPCENMGTAGWSGKMLQVWMLSEFEDALQGVEVRFMADYGQGVAWDRQNVGGWTSRFGLVEWDTWGTPSRYVVLVEDDSDPLVWNVRMDLHLEYCGAGTLWGRRPDNKPGWYSYAVWVVRKKEG